MESSPSNLDVEFGGAISCHGLSLQRASGGTVDLTPDALYGTVLSNNLALKSTGQTELRMFVNTTQTSAIFSNNLHWRFQPAPSVGWEMWGSPASLGFAIKAVANSLDVTFSGSIHVGSNVNCSGSLNCTSDEKIKNKLILN